MWGTWVPVSLFIMAWASDTELLLEERWSLDIRFIVYKDEEITRFKGLMMS